MELSLPLAKVRGNESSIICGFDTWPFHCEVTTLDKFTHHSLLLWGHT